MDIAHASRVTRVDRLSNGIVVEFEDGRSLIFTGLLLHSMIPAAIDITDLSADDASPPPHDCVTPNADVHHPPRRHLTRLVHV
jgi:hypothetical protein